MTRITYQPDLDDDDWYDNDTRWPYQRPSLLDSVRQLWQWDELAAEIGQESQARVALLGAAATGKSLLFNRLRGWPVSAMAVNDPTMAVYDMMADLQVESFGLFLLATLPPPPSQQRLDGRDLLYALGEPNLIVYLLDGEQGVTADDYRWVATLRATGCPLLLVLNKVDLLGDSEPACQEASNRLGMPIIPISAYDGRGVEPDLLLAMLNAVPKLAVPLGRELIGLRRIAARRIIRQVALFATIVGVQPVPFLDIPFQVMLQVGVVMRVGATYGYIPTGSMTREVIATVLTTLGMRYSATALAKMIPFLGWGLGGAVSGGTTLVLGEAAIRYYEAGGAIPLKQFVKQRLSRHKEIQDGT